MLIKNDAQRMAICYKELLRLRDNHILNDLDRSNAFNLFYEISGFYYSRGAGCVLGHIIQSRPWALEEIETYKKRPGAIIFEKSCCQEVSLRAIEYIDSHLTPVMKGYGTGYAYDNWAPLMNGFNGFLMDLLAKMMFTECNAIYYHCEEKSCFCVDTTQKLKPLRLIWR